MGLSVEWKGFDFSVLFQGAGSCDFFVGGWGVYPFQEGEAGNIMKVASNPADRWISREISGTPDTENPNAIFRVLLMVTARITTELLLIGYVTDVICA